MILKIIGSICIILSCGGFGYYLAWQHLKEEKCLREMIYVLEYMECELRYRLTALPTLLYNCSNETNGVIAVVLRSLACELEKQVSPDVDSCMSAVVACIKDIPVLTKRTLLVLGKQLGRFDLTGQVQCLDGVKQTCHRYMEVLSNERQTRLRRYKTLGLCAGAGLVILFI